MRKRIIKIAGGIAGVILLMGALGIFFVVNFLPNVGDAPELKVRLTPERIKRGEYLATGVTGCIDCHSSRDQSKFAAPIVEGTFGQGGTVFHTDAGMIVAPNITPDAIGKWTDGELFRAITSGVNKEGRPLFPLMPYLNFGKMDTEDIYDIIAYIRTLQPIHHPVERKNLPFPMNIIVHTMPRRARLAQRPPPEDSVRYGKYMVLAAGCGNCHSPKEKGRDVAGQEFSGGFAIPLPNGSWVRTANITPDKETGIGNWSRSLFVQRFKASMDTGFTHPVKTGEPQTEMPWTCFAQMSRTDLEAIYQYLQTVKPVKHKVSPFSGQ